MFQARKSCSDRDKANKPWTWQPFCYPCGSFVTADHLRREDHCRRAAGAPGTHYRSHPRQDEYETFDFDCPVRTVRYQHQFDFEPRGRCTRGAAMLLSNK